MSWTLAGRRTATATFVLAAVALSACSKSTTAVHSDGTCSYTTIEAYNSLMLDARMLKYNPNESSLVELRNKCSSFKSLIGGQSCEAMNSKTGGTTVVSSYSVDQLCSTVDSYFSSKSKSVSEPKLNTLATPTGQLEKNQYLRIELKNASALNELSAGGVTSMIQEGKVVTLGNANLSDGHCIAIGGSSSTKMKDGEELKLMVIGNDDTDLSLLSVESKLSFGCRKKTVSGKWTVEQLAAVFGQIANVKPTAN